MDGWRPSIDDLLLTDLYDMLILLNFSSSSLKWRWHVIHTSLDGCKDQMRIIHRRANLLSGRSSRNVSWRRISVTRGSFLREQICFCLAWVNPSVSLKLLGLNQVISSKALSSPVILRSDSFFSEVFPHCRDIRNVFSAPLKACFAGKTSSDCLDTLLLLFKFHFDHG